MLRTAFNGSPFVGVFARVAEEALLVTPELEETVELEEELGVEGLYDGTVGGSTVLGSMTTGNGAGLVVSSSATDRECDAIAEATGVPAHRVPGRINAVGNVVLCNDHGALVSPELTDEARATIRDALDVPVATGTLGGLNVVGSAAVATDRGVLVHPTSSEEELREVERALDVTADVGTVNYGTPLVGSGLLANGEGYVAGRETTGPELGRIEETLGFV